MHFSITAISGRTFSASLSSTRLFLRRQLWIWPIVAAVVLGIIGWFMHSSVEGALKRSMAANLRTILNADVTALKIWLEEEKVYAKTVAAAPRIRTHIGELLGLATRPSQTESTLLQAQALLGLRLEIQPWLEARHYNGFIVLNPQERIIAAGEDVLVGKANLALPEGIVPRLFAEEAGTEPIVTLPFRSPTLLEDEDRKQRVGLPTMFILAPVLEEGRTIAVLGLRIRPEADFTRILSVAQAGESGETYAFDEQGLLISQSRFDDELKAIGLLPDHDEIRSILNLEIRDPQVNLIAGERPVLKRAEWSLTRMAADATQGNSGIDVDGYRDYRGVPVIGAWMWLPEYGFGVATEVDVAEAFRPLYILRYVFWGLFSLLGTSAIIIFIFTLVVARLGRQARQAALKAKHLGQYTLEEKIGAGGLGMVYRGHHSMLRRPTAIKLLDVGKTTEETIARFEREVQLTSRLNHPNTVAVYDYGRTPEGVFYYAMELLDGINLEELVRQYGPQPEARVIHILEQICGSLIEAHSIGLIHRDIKPANIILSQRGGMADVIKLLDFGLVKALDVAKQVTLTAAGSLTGTPLYVSPEGIADPDQVDARSDLYAVGALGYYLLTGKPTFEGKSIIEICMHQVNTSPIPPSKRLGRAISRDLERLLLRCLKKDPEQRPQSARQLLHELQQCQDAGRWTEEDAEKWWTRHKPPRDKEEAVDSKAISTATIPPRDATLIVPRPKFGESEYKE
jgi:eukaryotic-like serine/threonine-protein kinase